MNLRKPFSASPATGGTGRLALTNALITPSVPPCAQMPSTLGSDGSCAAVLRWAVAEAAHLHARVGLEDLHGAVVAVRIHARAGDAGDHDHVALAVELVDEELG